MINKNLIAIVLNIAAVSFVLGFLVSSQLNKMQGKSGQIIGGENTFQAGWEAARQRLAETGFVPLAADMEIKSLSGQVQKIEGSKISLKIQPLEPLADPALDNRMVETDNNTKIYKLVQKDTSEYQKEMEEFNKKMEEQMKNLPERPEPLMPPEMYTKKEAALSDIKEGEQITVTTQEDIKEKSEFKATEIVIQVSP